LVKIEPNANNWQHFCSILAFAQVNFKSGLGKLSEIIKYNADFRS
jgi:hypothetical protein